MLLSLLLVAKWLPVGTRVAGEEQNTLPNLCDGEQMTKLPVVFFQWYIANFHQPLYKQPVAGYGKNGRYA